MKRDSSSFIPPNTDGGGNCGQICTTKVTKSQSLWTIRDPMLMLFYTLRLLTVVSDLYVISASSPASRK